MTLIDINNPTKQPRVATIGFFDGVHIGHQFLLNKLKEQANLCGYNSMVVTFSNHPRLFFHPGGLKLLSDSKEKCQLLENNGIDECLMLEFNAQVAGLTSKDFLTLLAEKYGVKRLLVGYDHHFGCDKGATVSDYISHGRACGIEVVVCDEFDFQQVAVSSSKIREALSAGDVELANRFLGRNYSVAGVVTRGNQIGRQLGFPTANIEVDNQKQLPKAGVYAVVVEHLSKRYSAMMNVGKRPTIGDGKSTLEVNLFDFDGDLYGEYLTVEFVAYIREERLFESLEKLKEMIEKDRQIIKKMLSCRDF